MDIGCLMREYGLEIPERVEELKRGTVSRAWLLTIKAERFVLRELANKKQAAYEMRITEQLHAVGFFNTPRIWRTKYGNIAVTNDERTFQLQTYCEGTMPNATQAGMPSKVGEFTAKLRGALDTCPTIDGATDRFELIETWHKLRNKWDELGMPINRQRAEARIENCAEYQAVKNSVIHGDLGIWNMLYDGTMLKVIDFGEARMGNRCFDIASAIGSLLNHSPKEKMESIIVEFMNAYKPQGAIDSFNLKQQLLLWYWRGILEAASTPRIPDNSRASFMHRLYDTALAIESYVL